VREIIMSRLREKIKKRESGIILYGLTPPKKKTEEEKRQSIAAKQVEYISKLGVDGLVLYDIDEEKDRISDDRPFPFIETLDPVIYSKDYLNALEVPRIVYRCVSKYSEESLVDWINNQKRTDDCAVFVGASADHQKVKLKLKNYTSQKQNILLGKRDRKRNIRKKN